MLLLAHFILLIGRWWPLLKSATESSAMHIGFALLSNKEKLSQSDAVFMARKEGKGLDRTMSDGRARGGSYES